MWSRLNMCFSFFVSLSDPPGHDNTVDNVSQDLFGPEGLADSTALQPDSDSETPDLMLEDNQPCTVVSPHPAAPFTFHVHAQGDAMHSHVQFLQSFCALHRVEGNNKDLEVLWFSSGGDAGSVLVDSVCQLLDSVVTACRDPPPLGPHDLVPQACQVAAQAMDLFCSQRLPSAEFMGRVQESLRELTAMLLHSNQPSRVSNGIRVCVLVIFAYWFGHYPLQLEQHK